jgi:hypothetical protein
MKRTKLPWHTPVIKPVPMVHVIGPEEAVHLQWAPAAMIKREAFLAGYAKRKVGRAPVVTLAQCEEVRAELEVWRQAGGSGKAASRAFVRGRLQARGLHLSRWAIDRKIIWENTS